MKSQTYRDGVLVEEWDDDARTWTRWDNTGVELERLTFEQKSTADGHPASFYDDQADARVEQDATLTDLLERVRLLEAVVFPPPGDPTVPDDPGVPTWAELPGGVWPVGGLVRDGGKTWRNVSGVPLTTAPSGFPGGTGHWSHLFVEAGPTVPAPDPDPPAEPDPDPEPAPSAPAWSPSATYKVGDRVAHNGHLWECKVAHGAEYQGTWAPGVAHAVWTDLGPV